MSNGNDCIGNDEMRSTLVELRINLENAIKLSRNDIVVALINEWHKLAATSPDQDKYFYNDAYCDGQTKTPLHLAYELNDLDVLRTLLNFNADPSIPDRINGKTIVDLAFASNKTTIKQIIYDALLQAILQNNLMQIKSFHACGLQMNASTYLLDSNSYLHWACLYSNESTIRFLLENGSDVNAVNKYGVTPMHEFISKRKHEKDLLAYLLSFRPNVDLKAIEGPMKDKSVLDLCDSELKEFISQTLLAIQETTRDADRLLDEALKTPQTPKIFTHEQLANWCSNADLIDKQATTTTDDDLLKLLWPRPQSVHLIDSNDDNRFQLQEPFYIFIKSSQQSSSIEFFNNLIHGFTKINFVFVYKEPSEPHICIVFDENLFHVENSYIINVKRDRIDISVRDPGALQYAFSTFLQLCTLFSVKHIPVLKIYDYPSVKFRGVLIDFSQGFYLKTNYLLALLQMLAYFKINQVHFYAKFSTTMQNKKQWYHSLENWYEIIRFCDQFNLSIIPTVDICSDVVDLYDVLSDIKEYLDLFKCCKLINVGPRLSTLLTCMENKNPFLLDSTQYLMLDSYLYQYNDKDVIEEINKFEKLVFMEYGLKVGHNFDQKCKKLHESGKPFYFCVGSANWNSLFGCPDGCLLNLFDSLNNIESNKPNGLLLCEFVGALTKTPFAFNLNSIMMFAGPSWNSNMNITEFRKYFPSVINMHGLLTDQDGQFGIIMLELGHLETFLTRKANNLKDFNELPLDTGSIFSRLILDPDDIELDFLDLVILKKSFFQLRMLQKQLKSNLNDQVHRQFKEVLLTIDLAANLIKLIMALYNAGTKQPTANVGLSVINIGVNNISKTFKTDFANKILSLNEELYFTITQYYYDDCLKEKTKIYRNLIEKLLKDNKDFNDLSLIINYENNDKSYKDTANDNTRTYSRNNSVSGLNN